MYVDIYIYININKLSSYDCAKLTSETFISIPASFQTPMCPK